MKDCKTLKDNYDDCRFVTARYDEEACVSFHNTFKLFTAQFHEITKKLLQRVLA